MNNLSFRQLRAFEAVAAQGSFTKAAQGLHVTQSALSMLIREMERELGVALFNRHTRRVELSEAGKDFHPHVRRMFNELSQAVSAVTDLRDKRRGVLRIAAPQLMACTLVPKVLARYRSEFPEVEIRLLDTLPEQLLERLQVGDAELVIGPDGGLDEAGLRRHPFIRDRHWVICRPEDPLCGRKSLRWQDLVQHRFIAPTRDFVARLRAVLGPHGEHLLKQPHTDTSYFTTAFGLVAAGLGITLSPTYAHDLVRAYGLHMLRIQAPPLFREVSVYSDSSKTLTPAAESFVACLDGAVKQGGFLPADGQLP